MKADPQLSDHAKFLSLGDRKITARLSRTQVTISIVLAITGLLLVTQLRGQSSFSNNIQAQTQRDLGEIIKNQNFEVEALRREITNNTIQLYKYSQTTADKKVILKEATKNLQVLKILAGLTGAKGQGVIIRIEDRGHLLNNHDLLDVIQELRSAGAEAMSINNQRVVAGSPFEQGQEFIKVNSVKLIPPYEIKAIGEPEILYQAIAIGGGARDTLSSLSGVSVKISKEREIMITPFKRTFSLDYAQPVE